MAVGLSEPRPPAPVAGARLAATAAGIRHPARPDLALMALGAGTRAAAVFTRNAFCAAPVVVARRHLAQGAPRYLLLNAGNANAGNGARGLADAEATCRALAQQAGCGPAEVLPFSTGVIGEPLPTDRIEAALPRLLSTLSDAGWLDAARAIMTTDTVPKVASRQLELEGRTVTITGMAKGSGMICPDMATMLAFVATDAAIPRDRVQALVAAASDASFNRITIDGDTSTNDACLLAATGAAGIELQGDEPAFYEALEAVFVELAQAIVCDGEGASKFVTVDVAGAADEAEARSVAYTVAHSPLVKTALYASDPNWGRILAAVGRAGIADLAIDGVQIALDDVVIVRDGGRAPDYTEARGQAVMDQAEIRIAIDLGRGRARSWVWTTDLSHEYVRINAEYRT